MDLPNGFLVPESASQIIESSSSSSEEDEEEADDDRSGSPLLGRRTSLAASTSPFLPSSAILPITSLLPTSPLLSKRKRPRSPNPSYGRPRRILLQAMLRTLLDLDILFYLENIEFFTT